MISNSELSEIIGDNVIKMMGFSDDDFYSLPVEYQNELLRHFVRKYCKEIKNNKEFQKKITLKRYNFEENVKAKVFKLVKKIK